MKKLVIFIIISSLLLSFAGCNNSGKPHEIVDTSKDFAGELNVYTNPDTFNDINSYGLIDEFSKVYPNVTINLTTAEDDSKMKTDMMSGKGPDIILINASSSIDWYKTVNAGAFYDMQQYINFENDDYYLNILNSINPSDEKYLIPISFNVPMFLTTSEALAEAEFNLDKCSDFIILSNEINRFLKDEDNIQNAIICSYGYNFSAFVASFSNLSKESVNINNSDTKRLAEEHKYFLDNNNKINDAKSHYPSFITGANYLTDRKALLYFNNEQSMPNRILLNAAQAEQKGETPVIYPIPNTKGEVSAQMSFTSAVNSNCKIPDVAYAFIKTIIDTESSINFNGVPFSKKKYSQQVNLHQEQFKTGLFSMLQDPIEVISLSDDFYKEYYGIFDSITSMQTTHEIIKMLDEYLAPYYANELSVDDCLNDAQNAFEIYMSE